MRASFVVIFVFLVGALGSTPSARADAFDDAMIALDRGEFAKGFGLLSPLADNGHAPSQYQLGALYRFGKGVKKNNRLAVEWYQKAAKQGYSAAQNNLGVMFELGAGIPKSYTNAAKWYEKAAANGDELAMGNLGVLYLKGLGVVQDKAKARKLFTMGAKFDDRRSKKYLKRLK